MPRAPHCKPTNEQIGQLLSDKDKDLRNTQRQEIRELARGQTLTVLQDLDARRKRSLLAFLHGTGLIRAGRTESPAVEFTGADLRYADLEHADMRQAHLGVEHLYFVTVDSRALYVATNISLY